MSTLIKPTQLCLYRGKGGRGYIRLWPPGWGTVQIGTGEAPPLCPSGNDLRGCWCSCSPHGRGSLPGRPPLSWSPQTPESTSPCLFGGEERTRRSRRGNACRHWLGGLQPKRISRKRIFFGGAGRRFLTCGVEKVEQEGPLVGLFHPDHFLGDVLRGGADTAHGQENVILQEITCKDLVFKKQKTKQGMTC